ncbi:phosphotransferase [Actinopolymorpha rutila]|uniref:tRNA A-37 threonylcarbamoyl transferase component Bud32 n=1 Tax=Actinopolymorpha rutila TaxID=446787 RepID=A0A852ZIJ7_9ACTN|nr:tRNA A-37 threonylcarbamoyl transferase component Bud32 [Actinopolymorpha rutila]
MKTFSADAFDRRRNEFAALRSVQHVVPVPQVLPTADPASIRMTFVPGILGQEWVAQDGPDRNLRHTRLMQQCGIVLRGLHDLGSDAPVEGVPGEGPVLVHGDFAPYNLIVDAETGELQAVIDWELAHRGSPVEDLAWLEWNMRIWYSPDDQVLEALYEAYGSLPAWRDRHQAMIDRCRPPLEASRRPSFPADVAERWAVHMERTYAFDEVVGRT